MGSLIKKELRKQLLSYRKLLSPAVFKSRNQRINEKMKLLLAKKQVKEIHVFLPMEKNREPDCHPTIYWAWENKIRTVTTRTNFVTRSLQHLYFDKETKLEASTRGIPEPLNGVETALIHTAVIFVPLMAFDKKGHRIGYGGGYYDKILSELSPTTLKVGLCLSGGMDAFTFVEAHDHSLDMIITPFETVEINE